MTACGRSATSSSRGPIFRASDWEVYKAVNQKFADIVVEEARNERPIVLVQDYHFALLPRMVRERLPEATIITFWHIPWPNSEVFRICPWRERDPRRPARQLDRRLPHPVPLQQLHRKRRPLPGKPHRARAFLDHLWRPDDAGPFLSDLDRVAAGERWKRSRRSPSAASRSSSSSACRRTPSCWSASSASTTPRASSTASSRWSRCSSTIPNGSAGWCSCRSPRRAAARCPPTSTCTRNAWPSSTTSTERFGSGGYKPIIMLDEHHDQEDDLQRLSRRRCLRGQQPARRHEPGGQGVRRGARRRAGRAHPQHLCRRLARTCSKR